MLTNLATTAALLVAGPTAAMRTYQIATQIKKVRNRKKDRTRPPLRYDPLVVALVPFSEK